MARKTLKLNEVHILKRMVGEGASVSEIAAKFNADEVMIAGRVKALAQDETVKAARERSEVNAKQELNEAEERVSLLKDKEKERKAKVAANREEVREA